jgi:hypothetical protein
MPRLLIVVEGGVIQGIFADAPVRVSVKDWDNIDAGEPYDPLEYYPVPVESPEQLERSAFEGLEDKITLMRHQARGFEN